MKVKYNNIFICSIKTTCFKNDESFKNKEIIEFGGCLLNLRTLQTYDPFSLIIKPNGIVTPYCTKKTGLTPEDINSGVSFIDLMQFVEKSYEIKKLAWASYGSFAKHVIKRQCQQYDIAFPFGDRFFNVKSWFPIIYNLEHEISLREAIKKLKLEIPDSRDCRDDAINTGIVFKETLRGPGSIKGKFINCSTRK